MHLALEVTLFLNYFRLSAPPKCDSQLLKYCLKQSVNLPARVTMAQRGRKLPPEDRQLEHTT